MSQPSGGGHFLKVPRSPGKFVDIPMDSLDRTPSPDPSLLSVNSSDKTIGGGSTERLVRSDTSFGLGLSTSGKGSDEPLDTESGSSKSPLTFWGSVRLIAFNWWNVLLIATIPASVIDYAMPADKRSMEWEIAVFICAFAAIARLASMLSFATEELQSRVGATPAALMNVSFGNAVELIIAILALIKCDIELVTLSLLGSILSNMLLVLGGAFGWGCYKSCGPLSLLRKDIRSIIGSYMPPLIPCVAVTAAPTAVYIFVGFLMQKRTEADTYSLRMSRVIACLLLPAYAFITYDVLCQKGKKSPETKVGWWQRTKLRLGWGKKQQHDAEAQPPSIQVVVQEVEEDLGDEPERNEPQTTVAVACGCLVIVTALVGYLSEILVSSVNELTGSSNAPTLLMAVIVIPIVGNAAEHWTAVQAAGRRDLEVSVGVALGSSLQIAMCVWPTLILIAWAMGKPLSFVIEPVLIPIAALAFIYITHMVQSRDATLVMGMSSLLLYGIAAVICGFYPNSLLVAMFTC